MFEWRLATTMSFQKQPGSVLENFVFLLSLLLLAGAIGSFFYLQYLTGQKNAELATISAEAAKTKTAEQKNIENRILTVRQQMRDFSDMIDTRKYGTKFFEMFESLVFPNVYFTKCSLDIDNLKVGVSGHTDSFESLGQQLASFEAANDVFEKITLGKVGISQGGGIDFDLEMRLKPTMVTPALGQVANVGE